MRRLRPGYISPNTPWVTTSFSLFLPWFPGSCNHLWPIPDECSIPWSLALPLSLLFFFLVLISSFSFYFVLLISSASSNSSEKRQSINNQQQPERKILAETKGRICAGLAWARAMQSSKRHRSLASVASGSPRPALRG